MGDFSRYDSFLPDDTYTARVSAAALVCDTAGNCVAQDIVWSFTTNSAGGSGNTQNPVGFGPGCGDGGGIDPAQGLAVPPLLLQVAFEALPKLRLHDLFTSTSKIPSRSTFSASASLIGSSRASREVSAHAMDLLLACGGSLTLGPAPGVPIATPVRVELWRTSGRIRYHYSMRFKSKP